MQVRPELPRLIVFLEHPNESLRIHVQGNTECTSRQLRVLLLVQQRVKSTHACNPGMVGEHETANSMTRLDVW
jgi:hypothetical protein